MAEPDTETLADAELEVEDTAESRALLEGFEPPVVEAPEVVAAAAAKPVVAAATPDAALAGARRRSLVEAVDVEGDVDAMNAARKARVAVRAAVKPADLTDTEWAEVKKDARTRASTAASYEDATEAAVEAFRAANQRVADRTTRANADVERRADEAAQFEIVQARITRHATKMRGQYKDFDETLRTSGMLDQIMPDKDGKIADPDLNRVIYSNENVPRAMYLHAIRMLAEKNGVAFEAELEKHLADDNIVTTEAAPAPKPPTPAAPAPKPTPTEAAAAARAAERRVIEDVTKPRPRRIETFTPAGKPGRTLTSAQLEWSRDHNPNAYAVFMENNPEVYRLFMSGALDQVPAGAA